MHVWYICVIFSWPKSGPGSIHPEILLASMNTYLAHFNLNPTITIFCDTHLELKLSLFCSACIWQALCIMFRNIPMDACMRRVHLDKRVYYPKSAAISPIRPILNTLGCKYDLYLAAQHDRPSPASSSTHSVSVCLPFASAQPKPVIMWLAYE